MNPNQDLLHIFLSNFCKPYRSGLGSFCIGTKLGESTPIFTTSFLAPLSIFPPTPSHSSCHTFSQSLDIFPTLSPTAPALHCNFEFTEVSRPPLANMSSRQNRADQTHPFLQAATFLDRTSCLNKHMNKSAQVFASVRFHKQTPSE